MPRPLPRSPATPHPRPFYYLENFCTALEWLRTRYADLLNDTERTFIEQFPGLPRESAGLLVRMVGRKGEVFRTGKLKYAEIGCPLAAASTLIDRGWVEGNPVLDPAELGRLLRKPELLQAFNVRGAAVALRKPDLLRRIGSDAAEARTFAQWWPKAPDAVLRLTIGSLCERLRVLFFGNFRQDWSEFVLTDLGIFKYEKIVRDGTTRAFQTRNHIDTFFALFDCRQRLEGGSEAATVLAGLPQPVPDNEWLESRRQKLQFQIAQLLERQRDLTAALEVYGTCSYAGSRVRSVRVLERLGRVPDALALASQVCERPADDGEAQQIERMLPRLRRKAGLASSRCDPARGWLTFNLVLPAPERPAQLERAVAAALSQPEAPVHYVENGLINSLFGLLCWDAIFAPVPGAFFHEFQAGPADLHVPGFRLRRESQFARCLGQLDEDRHRATIRRNFELKAAIQSPFVFWGVLSEPLLSLALDCLPPRHLKACFERILGHIRANRSGLPDLVQFWPAERRYRLIEVKGPGDRLQDNQVRWLRFCVSQGIPVSVCRVDWSAAGPAAAIHETGAAA